MMVRDRTKGLEVQSRGFFISLSRLTSQGPKQFETPPGKRLGWFFSSSNSISQPSPELKACLEKSITSAKVVAANVGI
jgi:hypothetical protein